MGMMGIGSDRAVRSHEELGPYGFASAAGTGFRTRIPMPVRQLEDRTTNSLLDYVEDVVQEMFEVFGVGD